MYFKQLVFLTGLFLFVCHPSLSQTRELDSLTLKLAFQKPDSSKVNTSLKIIEILYDNQDYKRAIQFIDESERLAQSLNYSKGIALASYYKAMIFANKDDYYNATDYFLKAKDIFERLGDNLGLAKVNSGIGLIEINRGNYQKGLEYSLKAISTFEEQNLYTHLSTAYNNLATAYFNTEKLDKSLEYNLKAADTRSILKDSAGLAETYKHIAAIFSLKNNPKNAIDYYNRVLDYSKNGNQQLLKGEILPKIGLEYLNLKMYDKAVEYLIVGLRYNRRSGNKEGLLQALSGLARYNIIKRQFRTAESQALEAGSIVNEMGLDDKTLEHYDLMVTLDSARGNFKGAFLWQKEYQKLKDKIHKKELIASQLISKESEVPDTQPIQKDLKDETPASKIESELISQQKLLIYGLLGVLIVVCIILILVLSKRQKSAEHIKELEAKHKQVLISQKNTSDQVKKLEEINAVKDKLFSIISHDLKDSVTSIKAFLDLLKDGSLNQEEFDKLVPELSENADNAALLLVNLLNWSKSQMESLKPKPDFFDLQEAFKQKAKLVEQKMLKKQIQLIDETKSETVYADRSMIEIVIQNLLTNAAKFCREGDSITITNSAINGKVVFAVKDTGLGISAENQEKLFKNSFTTVGTSNEKGTGLGLTICKELVELNHGKIWVESTENIGSKFYVELPRGPVSRP